MNHLRIRRSGVRISPGALDRSLASAGDLLVLATKRMLSSGETGSLCRCGLRSESMVTREMWSCRPCDRPLESTVDGRHCPHCGVVFPVIDGITFADLPITAPRTGPQVDFGATVPRSSRPWLQSLSGMNCPAGTSRGRRITRWVSLFIDVSLSGEELTPPPSRASSPQ